MSEINEDFEIRIGNDFAPSTTRPHGIAITHNGYQWAVVACETLEQLMQVEREIHNYITEKIKEKGNAG